MTVEHRGNKGDLELMSAVAESWILGSSVGGRNLCYSQNFRVHFKFSRGGEKEQG